MVTKTIRRLLPVVLVCLGVGIAAAHSVPPVNLSVRATVLDSIRQVLLNQGFQSVRVISEEEELIVSFENRRYRFEVRALEEVVRLVAPLACGNFSSLVLVPRSHDIAIASIKISEADFCRAQDESSAFLPAAANASFRVASYERLLRGTRTAESSNFRMVVELEPQILFSFGSYSDAFRHQFNLLPAAQLYLWKGMRVTLQGIIPLSNEIPIPEQDWVRPGFITATQYVRLPAQFFASLTAGYFSDQRYGFALELNKVTANGAMQFQGAVGFTGYGSYPKLLNYDTPVRGWQFSDLSYLDYRAGVTYRVPWWDLRFSVEAGRYLSEEEAVRFAVTRQFTELDIGFFAQRSDRGNNYGFQLSVPLFPPRYMKPGRVQFRPSKHMRYTYFATQAYLAEYQTGELFDDFIKKLNPLFINNQFKNNKN